MTTYRAALNHNVALASLTVFAPQPRSIGVIPTRRTFTSGATVVDEGLHVELIWETLEDATQYQAVLAVMGLTTVRMRSVTLYARNDLYQWRRYNGVAVRPQPGADVTWNLFPRSITVLVRDLVQLA